jgi:hypothetical protein
MSHHFIKYRSGSILSFLMFFFSLWSFAGNGPVRENACNYPELLADTTVKLVYTDTLMVTSFYDFTLPVNIRQGGNISAMTLGFFFPTEYLEITGLEMADGIQGSNYIVMDSLFRMAWSAIDPLVVVDHGTVIYLKIKTKEMTGLDETLKLILDATSEFEDESANIIDGVVLEIPEIYFPAPVSPDTTSGHYFRIYPNPFKDDPLVEFYLDDEYQVKITLSNANGEEIKQLTDTVYQKGIHHARLFCGDLAKGTYLLRFDYSGGDESGSELIKVISIH